MAKEVREAALQLDDHLKNLLRELDTRSMTRCPTPTALRCDCRRARSRLRHRAETGRPTIGLAKRDAAAAEAAKLTTQDRRFLESLRIQVDQESFLEENDKKAGPRLAMTPQDVRFLKSLRIANG